MARNVEIKVAVADLAAVRAAAQRFGAALHASEAQTDRYYRLDGGRRLKLRTVTGGRAELIDYTRPENSGVRTSEYAVTPVRDAEAGRCRVPAERPLAVVCKRREIWLWENVRIHLDDVDTLGTFVELEAVVDDRHDEAACRRQVDQLMQALALSATDLIRASYAELLTGQENTRHR